MTIPTTALYEGAEIEVPEPVPGQLGFDALPGLMLGQATGLRLRLTIDVARTAKRRLCTRCRRRRYLYSISLSGDIMGASLPLCAEDAGLSIHGGRRST